MTVRAWGYSTFAAYVDDGGYGRFVGTAQTREDAETLAVQQEKRTEQAYDDGSGPAGLPSTAGPDRITLTAQEERL